MFYVAEPFAVRETIRKGEMKICDSCGRILTVDTAGSEDCFITGQGLVCVECACKIRPVRINHEDSNIWNGLQY